MGDCLFCRIIEGDIPSKKVYENDWVLAFEDISPAAKVHVLLVPKKHFENILELGVSLGEGCPGRAGGDESRDADGAKSGGTNGGGTYGGDGIYAAELFKAINKVAELTGVDKSGFRLICNCGRDAGQTVPHLHCHILGGQHFGEALL